MIFYKKIAQIDFRRFAPPIAVASTVLLLALLSFGGYHLYRSWQDRAAQKVVGGCLESYRQELKSANPDWQKVETEFFFAGQELGANALAPFCFTFYAEALLQKGDFNGALTALSDAIEKLPENSLVLHLFKTKQALMMMDAADEIVRKEGLSLLLDLAKNQDNKNRDIALYYAGYHYWTANKLEEAKKIWQELVDEYRHEKAAPSPWSALAVQKLTSIL